MGALISQTDVFQCQLDRSEGGLGGSTAYMSCGEGLFPIKRLYELVAAKARNTQHQSSLLANVHIMQCYNAEDALDTMVFEYRW